MILEILLAWFDNLTPVFLVLALAGGGASFFGTMMVVEEDANEGQRTTGRTLLRIGLPFLIIGSLVATVPSTESLWKVRVGLLKLELASPENVRAVGGHIEDIVKALECKHLNVNCPEKKEAK